MKAFLSVVCCALLSIGTSVRGQDSTQLQACKRVILADPVSHLSPDICTTIVAELPANETVEEVTDDGTIASVTPDGVAHIRSLPPNVRAGLVLNEATRAVREGEAYAEIHPQSLAASFLPGWKKLWTQVRDVYCSYRPAETFTDPAGKQQVCLNQTATGDPDKRLDELSFEVTEMQSNLLYSMTTGSTNAVHDETAATPASGSFLVASAPKLTGPAATQSADGSSCQKAITFAIARRGGLQFALPNVSAKWLDKMQRKYPGVCFPQRRPEAGQSHYLVVLSSSSSVFNGLEPVYQTNTSTAPVSGSGILTDSYGSTWSYTYEGTETTTMTSEANVPYADTTTAFYANAYSQGGRLVASSERTRSVREGGDPSSAAGYNITSALLSIHWKEHLVESIIKQINSL